MISVIIPVYRVEKYIQPCIRALLEQSYTDFEIVLVNDGTPDRSAELARELLESQSKLPYQILETENRGVSAARNTGLEHAAGEYVVMVDADDVIDRDFLRDFADLTRKHPDANIYSCGFTVVSEENCETFSYGRGKTELCSREEAQLHFFRRSIKFLLPALLLKRSFLTQHGIRFDEQVRYSEDVQFIWRCLAYNDRELVHLYKNNYNYVLHPGSTMTASGIEKILTFCGGLERLFDETKGMYCETVNRQLVPKMFFSMLHGVAKMLPYPDFCTVYTKAGCKRHMQALVKQNSGLQLRLTAAALLTFRRVGYAVMRRA